MLEQQMQSPFLIGKRVYLRPLEPDQDAHQLSQWYNNQDLRRYILTPYIMNDSRYREFISGLYKNSNLVACGIASKKENKLVGAIGLRNIDHVYQSAELYMIKIDPQEQGKGYGTEATQLILHYGFMELNLNRIESLDVEENISAWKVDEKLGFQLEGLKREAFFRNGRPYNVRIYSLLRREYRELFLNSPVYADIREMLSLEEG
jgi:RimJ/RimL family protein N-acetyltransferase